MPKFNSFTKILRTDCQRGKETSDLHASASYKSLLLQTLYWCMLPSGLFQWNSTEKTGTKKITWQHSCSLYTLFQGQKSALVSLHSFLFLPFYRNTNYQQARAPISSLPLDSQYGQSILTLSKELNEHYCLCLAFPQQHERSCTTYWYSNPRVLQSWFSKKKEKECILVNAKGKFGCVWGKMSMLSPRWQTSLITPPPFWAHFGEKRALLLTTVLQQEGTKRAMPEYGCFYF